jgi:hypothetical protein
LSVTCSSVSSWAIHRMLKNMDDDGIVKDAAKKGVVNLISRWMK